jgi:hypothetical protein
MTVLSWGRGDVPPGVAHVLATVGIAGAVLLVAAYFAVKVMQDRAYRKLRDEGRLPSDDPDVG